VKGYGFGPEFLVWLPKQETFASIGLLNTSRNEGPALIGQLSKGPCTVLFSSRLAENKAGDTWEALTIELREFDVDMSKIPMTTQKTVSGFLNPPASWGNPPGESAATSERD
jgi:hypothetical protein